MRIDLPGQPLDGRLAEHFDELVHRWHDGGGVDMDLHAWLGLSAAEYAATAAGEASLPLRWRLFPPDPRHGWTTDSTELSEHRWDEIVAGLWVGGYETDRHGPDLADFDLVVSADSSSARVDVAAGDELRCFFDDAGVPDPSLVAAPVTLAAAAWQTGARVLVRCAYGQNRSAYLAALMLHTVGWPTAHAVHRLRERRGRSVLENPSFVAALRALDGDVGVDLGGRPSRRLLT